MENWHLQCDWLMPTVVDKQLSVKTRAISYPKHLLDLCILQLESVENTGKGENADYQLSLSHNICKRPSLAFPKVHQNPGFFGKGLMLYNIQG